MKIETSYVPHSALSICAIILSAALAWASPVTAATSNISASVTIVPPVAITERSDIRFSSFVAGATPGTITLLVPSTLPDEMSTSQTQLKSGLGAVQISGPPSDSFSVSTEVSTTLTSGDNTMTVNGIELRYGANGTAGAVSGPGILNSAGTGTIVIGGVLNVAAGQAAGAYTGSLMVSMDY